MNANTTAQAVLEARRSALYAREASGEVVADSEWEALGADQQKLNDERTDSAGYFIR